ncbi:unnamed protein product [Rotaria magnacalcarata]|uniref:t-SNARE coiled-coil homology domain-containing protein n=1 Tax=Rotaria magnacalcarata TaxID=392030 RepID=A0A819HMN6_9BILA|nr:unnamed protein product [Rotaria magnacalcarata]
MTTVIDTFLYLQRDIEQSFQRVQTIFSSSHYDRRELDRIFNHISCTLDDLEKVNQLINSSSSVENESVNITSNQNASLLLNLSENDLGDEVSNSRISIKNSTKNNFTVGYSKENEERLLVTNSNATVDLQPSFDEREDFIRRMKLQHDYYKNKIQSINNETQMEIIQLDQTPDDHKNEDHIIRKQDEQLEQIHHSIVSLKNLTQNINFEINDHIRVLDNLETGMIDSQGHVERLTNQTKTFIRSSADDVGGHTCLFALAVGLFFILSIGFTFVFGGSGVIANISVQLNKSEKHDAKFCLSRVLLNDINLVKSSMTDKSNKSTLEQITDKMEELDVEKEPINEELDEETLAMRAMGLPTSFTSSLIERGTTPRQRTHSRSLSNEPMTGKKTNY